jgi:SAM-dependent methyltransferase
MKSILKNEQHSVLLEKYFPLIEQLILPAQQSCVLDLACGTGRNGHFLIEQSVDVCFSDKNSDALNQIENEMDTGATLKQKHGKATFWNVDFEKENNSPLQGKCFAGVIVFRYLHRPLFEQIKSAIAPGGFIIYETFTVDNREYGRPNNPHFLLQKRELLEVFSGWQVIHYFEGVVMNKSATSKQAIAQIVAIKPY